MKVSLNWAQAHSNVPLNDVGTEALVEKIGAQLGAVEELEYFGPRYDGIVAAKVVSCQKHPDADKLSVCVIDDAGVVQNVARDDNGHVQVVCGAPNVRAGQTVAWLPPGVTVPASLSKEPLVLEAREIRGQVSNGMLASPSELGISDNHEGILEIDEKDAKPGQLLKELFGLDDVVIDIENKMFTHRPDCFGVLGVARELAGIQGKKFTSPDWYIQTKPLPEFANSQISVNIETELVPRFCAVAMAGVKVAHSPTWLQAGLNKVGLKPINNVVDITNYLMYVTGQPLHAYDADKLSVKNTLGARLSKKGEKVALLNGKVLELQDDSTVVIVSGEDVVGVGGVIGGKDTEVSAETTNIIIECASFDMYSIRRTSMKYGLFTDAATRFTKGQSPLQNTVVISKAVAMIGELADGKQSSSVADKKQPLAPSPSLSVQPKFINERLGSNLTQDEMAKLLTNVEFGVVNVVEGTLEITPPFWRTDIEIAEDIVEEVGRLHGYDNLPLTLPPRPTKPATKNPLLELKNGLRNCLSSAGANELLTYGFVHENLLKNTGQSSDLAFQLSNALSPDLQFYRMSLTPSLLERVQPNIKAGQPEFALFELGTVHNKLHKDDDNGLPKEFPTLALVTASATSKTPAYYQARAYLDFLAHQFGLSLRYDAIKQAPDYPVVKPFDETRSAIVTDIKSGQVLGIIGEYKQSVLRNLKLPVATAGFEIGLEELLRSKTETNYQKLSKFPSVQQDISLKVPAGVTYQQIYDVLSAELLGKPDVSATFTPLDSFQRPDDTEHAQYAFRLTIAHHHKTLKSEEVNGTLDAAAKTAQDKLGAERI